MHPKELTTHLSKGDPEAFRYLFSEYYAALCIYASRFTKDKSSAEEIVHETFVKLWEHKEHIGITESISGYLYKSVQNNALNYLKKLQINNKYTESYFQKLKEAEEFFTISQETGQSVLLAKELEEKILEAIEELPQQCKEIFKLSRFNGLKNQEIASKKQITLNTVQTQISIALEKLRKSLGQYLPQLILTLLYVNILN
jgi:RNA polymerase sigma-70 factor (ECF subfamily)